MKVPVEGCPELFDPGGGVRWWLADRSWQEAARAAAAEIAEPAAISGDRLLKAGRRRLVFVGRTDVAGDFVVKAFPLHGLRSRLKHRKYGFSEAQNLAQARRRGIPAPALYGLGFERRFGTVRWNAVLMQRVGGRTLIEALADAPDDSARDAWLRRTARLFRVLYLAGCNHIDLKPEAVHLGEDASEDAVIDFQYCSFLPTPRLDTVMAQAGHFTRWWEKLAQPEPAWVQRFTAILLDVLEVPPEKRPEARERFELHRRHVPSIAERLRQ